MATAVAAAAAGAPEPGEELLALDGRIQEDEIWGRAQGVLEDVILDKRFEEARNAFCRRHCHSFDAATQAITPRRQKLFQAYAALMEGHILGQLVATMPGFSREQFHAYLADRQRTDQLEVEVYDLLASFCFMDKFRELMLAYKTDEERLVGGGRLQLLSVQAAPLHRDDMQDGEPRPDLDTSLRVARLSVASN